MKNFWIWFFVIGMFLSIHVQFAAIRDCGPQASLTSGEQLMIQLGWPVILPLAVITAPFLPERTPEEHAASCKRHIRGAA